MRACRLTVPAAPCSSTHAGLPHTWTRDLLPSPSLHENAEAPQTLAAPSLLQPLTPRRHWHVLQQGPAEPAQPAGRHLVGACMRMRSCRCCSCQARSSLGGPGCVAALAPALMGLRCAHGCCCTTCTTCCCNTLPRAVAAPRNSTQDRGPRQEAEQEQAPGHQRAGDMVGRHAAVAVAAAAAAAQMAPDRAVCAWPIRWCHGMQPSTWMRGGLQGQHEHAHHPNAALTLARLALPLRTHLSPQQPDPEPGGAALTEAAGHPGRRCGRGLQ